MNWNIAALFVAGGVLGGFFGLSLATRLATRRGLLVKIFAVVLFGVAAYMLFRSAGPLLALRS